MDVMPVVICTMVFSVASSSVEMASYSDGRGLGDGRP